MVPAIVNPRSRQMRIRDYGASDMRSRLLTFLAITALGAGPVLVSPTAPAEASHSWAGYHWGRTSTPFTLRLGDNVSSAWDSYLRTTSSDWSASTVLDTIVVTGGSSAKRCAATVGRIEVCSSGYGRNGWLGIASIWASGGHITQATVKMNDTYFNTASYNTPAWRNLVMCQEVGHTFGLDHQDEDFSNANLGTCMDYTNNPSSNQKPNQHDYDQLMSIYGHLDNTTTVGALVPAPGNRQNAADNEPGNGAAEWGQSIRFDAHGRPNVFVRELGQGQRKITHVFWIRPGEHH